LSPSRQRDARGVPWLDFGGRGPTLHFAHANGYPPGAYRALLEDLAGDHRVFAVSHRPLWSAGRPEAELKHWDRVAEDLIAFLDGLGGGPVIGAGHSLGATSTMFAALRRPDLFRALVLVDPVFVTPAAAAFLALAPRSAVNRVPVVGAALRRREAFASVDEAFDYYRRKPVFEGLSDAALRDYVEAALRPDGQGLRLAYPREWEAQLYRTVPWVWHRLGGVTMPVLGLRGARSGTLMPSSFRRWRRLQPHADLQEVPGCGHLAPLELPAEIARRIRAFTTRL
jgi:pimeloyl-ACP methyl ester carboxylesterase